MNDYELFRLIASALSKAEKECKNNIYVLTVETLKKLRVIDSVLNSLDYAVDFDAPTNSISISVKSFVFDSLICDLKRVFQLVDLFVIDSLDDGKVCIEMNILNAAEVMRRD